MEPRIILDTNILLKVINKEPGHETVIEILDRVDSRSLKAVISTITVAEVAVGYYTSGDTQGLDNFIQLLYAKDGYTVREVTTEIAKQAARIRSETGLRLPDAIIAATGVATGASYIVTEDKEFMKAAPIITSLTPDELLDTLKQITK